MLPDLPIDLSDKEKSEYFGQLNKALSDIMFNIMKLHGFTPQNIEYYDTYFIFKHNPNSNIHFRVKEVWNHFKFGMWVNSEVLFNDKGTSTTPADEMNVISVFCQYDTQIDKFKPSRSSLCVNVTKKDMIEWLEHKDTYFQFYFDLKYMIEFIKYHPILAYNDWEVEFWTINKNPVKNFIRNETTVYKNEFLDKSLKHVFTIYANTLVEKFNRQNEVKTAYIVPENERFDTSTLVEVRVIFKPEISDDELNECIDRIWKNSENKVFEYRWLHYGLIVEFFKAGRYYA